MLSVEQLITRLYAAAANTGAVSLHVVTDTGDDIGFLHADTVGEAANDAQLVTDTATLVEADAQLVSDAAIILDADVGIVSEVVAENANPDGAMRMIGSPGGDADAGDVRLLSIADVPDRSADQDCGRSAMSA